MWGVECNMLVPFFSPEKPSPTSSSSPEFGDSAPYHRAADTRDSAVSRRRRVPFAGRALSGMTQ
jgi:hypothetical protein